MQKYKIKLMPEDHVRTRGLSISDFENLVSRFFQDGCAEGDYNTKKFHDYDWIGWGMNGIKFCDNSLVFEGRELNFSEIMELAEPQKESSWHERGELPPIDSFCECDYLNDGNWVKGKIATHVYSEETGRQAIFQCEEFWCARSVSDKSFRPIKSEREKAIEFAHEIIKSHRKEIGNYNDKTQLGALYDAGLLKLPEAKTPADFKASLISLMKDHGVDFRAASRDKTAVYDEDFSYFFCKGDELLFCDAELAEELYEIEKREKGAK